MGTNFHSLNKENVFGLVIRPLVLKAVDTRVVGVRNTPVLWVKKDSSGIRTL